jgi:hypothetical protein
MSFLMRRIRLRLGIAVSSGPAGCGLANLLYQNNAIFATIHAIDLQIFPKLGKTHQAARLGI